MDPLTRSWTKGIKAAAGRFARNRHGGPAVAFALILPVLMLMVVGLIDFGAHMLDTTALRNAARAAVEYARVKPTDTAGIKAVAVQTGQLDASTLTVTTTLICECSPGVAIQCTSQCATTAMQKYVKVDVAQPFTPIIPYPELLLPSTVTGEATLRYQ